jgi:hypothetical protein
MSASSAKVSWSFLLGSYAFVAPMAVTGVSIIGAMVYAMSHRDVHFHADRVILIDAPIFFLSGLALVAWFGFRKRMLRLSDSAQVLLATAAWIVTLLGFGMCLRLLWGMR